MTLLLSLTASLIASAPMPIDDCRYEAERTATIDAADTRMLHVLARSGSLVVEGRPGLREIRVRGRACASDRDLLDEIRLTADRSGADVRVEAELPDGRRWWNDHYARLDLVIEAPAGIAAEIDDTSGEMELRGLGALTVDDGSGEMTVEDIAGPVTIGDSSGEIWLARIGGDVEIDDSSGDLDIREVQGSVTLTDGSGGIDVEQVTGSVIVRRDGSGSIRVAGVHGNFVVERDGSGSVRYHDVGGQIRVAAH